MNTIRTVVTVVLIVVWLTASSCFNLEAKKALTDHGTSIIVFTLSTCLCGSVFALPELLRLYAVSRATSHRKHVSNVLHPSATRPQSFSALPWRRLCIVTALHLSGSFCTNFALLSGTISSYHTFKCLEPVVVYVLGHRLFQYPPLSPYSLGAIAVVSSGAMLTASMNLAIAPAALPFACGSLFAFSTCHLLSKSMNDRLSGTALYGLICFISTIVLIPPALIHALSGADVISSVRVLLLACIFHAVDSGCSFSVLSLVTPIAHSVLSSVKRCSIICAAIVVALEIPGPIKAFGIVFSLGGALLFTLTRSEDIDVKKVFWTGLPAVVVCAGFAGLLSNMMVEE